MRGCIVLAISVSIMAVPASAQRIVSEWNVLDIGKWSYEPLENAIHITDSDPDVFSFETYDLTTGAPLDFDLVICDTSDPVSVRIAADPNSARTYGARHVHEINLSASSDGEIHDVRISGDMGLFGPIVANRIESDFTVDGDVFNLILVDEAIGDINVGTLQSGIIADSLGNVNVTTSDTHGGIYVSEPYTGVIDITGSIQQLSFFRDL